MAWSNLKLLILAFLFSMTFSNITRTPIMLRYKDMLCIFSWAICILYSAFSIIINPLIRALLRVTNDKLQVWCSGYHACFTRRRSWVQSPLLVEFFFCSCNLFHMKINKWNKVRQCEDRVIKVSSSYWTSCCLKRMIDLPC